MCQFNETMVISCDELKVLASIPNDHLIAMVIKCYKHAISGKTAKEVLKIFEEFTSCNIRDGKINTRFENQDIIKARVMLEHFIQMVPARL